MGFWQNKRKRWVSIASGTAVVAAAAIATSVYLSSVPAVRDTTLQLSTSRDIGALPVRGTGAGQFCGAVGTLGAPKHCYVTGGTGNLTDLGTGAVNLTKTGTVREAVATGLPVQSGGSVSWASELTSWFDVGSYEAAGGVTLGAAGKVSVTLIFKDSYPFTPPATGYALRINQAAPARAIRVDNQAAGKWRLTLVGASSTVYLTADRNAGWNCITFVGDTSGANLGAVHMNGTTVTTGTDLSGAGNISLTGDMQWGGPSGYRVVGAYARMRLDDNSVSLADHRALCGDFTKPLRTNHLNAADSTYTHTGGARCFAMSDTTATCLPGGAAGYGKNTQYRWSWVTEPSRTNRLLNSAALNAWTVTGNPELLTDGDMELAGIANWPTTNGTTTKDTTAPLRPTGAQHLRVAYLATTNPWSAQNGVFTVGTYFTFSGWMRASGAGITPSLQDLAGQSFCNGVLGDTAWNYCTGTKSALNAGVILRGTGVDAGGEYYEFDDLSVTLHGTPAVAPDGSLTAYTVSNVATITTTGSGYTASASVYPRFWLKCSTGTLSFVHTGGNGNWTIDCTHASLAGKWSLIHAKHAAVSVTTHWTTTSTGTVTPAFSGTEFSLWLPTITERDGISVIPTGSTVATTGDSAFNIANSTPVYWTNADTVYKGLNEIAGMCLSTGPTLRMSGAPGSECTGYWRRLDIYDSEALDNLWLKTSRDLCALPARGTGAGQWCGDMGWGLPQNCYYTGGTGGLTDYGTQGVNLTKSGTPREGVATGLPVRDGSGGVSWTSEKATYAQGDGFYSNLSGHTLTLSAQHSVTWVQRSNAPGFAGQPWAFYDPGAGGHYLFLTQEAGGTWQYQARGTAGAGDIGGLDQARQEWACYTLAYDASAANATKLYRNGSTLLTFNTVAHGSIGYTNKSIYLYSGPSSTMEGAVARMRYEGPVALTLAQHQALCGSFTQPLRTTHAAYADSTWSGGTGGARCFQMSATSAVCLPGSAAGYGWDGTGVGWAFEDARTNRLLYSAALNKWTVTGNPELLTDGDMEAVGVGDWTAVNAAMVTKDTGAPHGGARNLRVAYNTTTNPAARQAVLTAGSYYRSTGWGKGDAAKAPAVLVGSAVAWTGTTAADWQEYGVTALAYTTAAEYRAVTTGAGFAEFDDLSVTLHGTPAVAPDGSLTAYSLASTATITSPTATGYTNNATLYPRVWVNCTGAATVTLEATVGAGEWTVACDHASLSGSWALIHGTHAAVTEVTPWTASATGTANFVASGTAAYSLWLPTLTEVAGDSVIPTLAAAVTTSDQAWTFDNNPAKYWSATSSSVYEDVNEDSGDCLVTGSTISLTGAVGSECTGTWHELKIANKLSLDVTKDLGALPSRDVWCGAVGSLGEPEHAYTMQETSGNLTDCSPSGGLTLTAAGTPRYNVAANIPVLVDTEVDFTSEKGIASDGSGRFTGTDTVAAVASITVVWSAKRHTAAHAAFDWGFIGGTGAGYRIEVGATGLATVAAYMGTVRSAVIPSLVADDMAIHCATVAFNGAATKVFVDQADSGIVWPGDYGNTTSAKAVAIESKFDGSFLFNGTIYRFRVDHAVATLADHQALCGSYGRPVNTNNMAHDNATWTQTGAARCFPTGNTSSVCLPGTAAGYAWDLTDVGPEWAIEPNRTNRLLYSAQINCVNWTCSGLGGELLADGDMEAAAATPPWIANASAVLSKEIAAPHGGARSLRVTYNGANYPNAQQSIATTGKYYHTTAYAHGNGADGGMVKWAAGTTIGTFTSDTGWQAIAATTQCNGTGSIALQSNSTAAGYAEFDDVSVKEVFPTITSAVAPDGSLTAAAVVFAGAETLSKAATGYTAATTVYPIMWIKCAAGTLSITNTTGTGDWDVDCTHASLSGSWTLTSRTHPAVMVNTAWASDGAGVVTPTFAGADFSLWLPTITEVEGFSVIPTGAAAVTVGAPSWSFDNTTSRRHWQPGAQVRYIGTDVSGMCLVPSMSSVLLTGSPACTGYINSIEILR